MGKLILLIEDDDQEQAVLSRYLEFVGARVVVAGDGEEGIRKAIEDRPDLILLDMRLPKLDGWAVIQRIQMHPETSGIPVVAVTGMELESERLEAAGFCGYLRKPFTPYHVLEEVERCLGTLNEPLEPAAGDRRSGDPRTSYHPVDRGARRGGRGRAAPAPNPSTSSSSA